MLDADTLRRIRRIEFKTRRLVNESFAGAYHSVFKGRGIAFDSVRPYEPGDDVRDIDWNVTARAGTPFIKRYVEERELNVLLLLDSSASALFGTVNRPKRDLAAELGAVLAFSAISNNDKIGLLIFSDQIEHYIPPRKGRNHVLRLTRDLLTAEAQGKGTDISLALRTANRFLKHRAIIFLLSDFLVSGKQYARELLVTNRHHDVIAIVISDPREQRWPRAGLVGVSDAETNAIEWMDTTSTEWQRQFEARVRRFSDMRDATLSRAGVDRIDIPHSGDYVRALTAFFHQRARQINR